MLAEVTIHNPFRARRVVGQSEKVFNRMWSPGPASKKVWSHPVTFAFTVIKQFRANQGVLLAGAVAYYTLLSLVPLLILILLALSHIVPEDQLLSTLSEYLEFVVPGQSGALVAEVRTFLIHKEVVGGILLVTLLFFSALAFTILENAMSVIFFHRVKIKRRHFLVSAVLPYLFILLLGVGLLVVTVVAGALQFIGAKSVTVMGHARSLDQLSVALLYLVGVAGEMLLLTTIYFVMPVGRISFRHAVIGGGTATLLWEITRQLLVWYYATMSQIQVVYGSLTTSIAVLLSMEIGTLVLLMGAQVIAEYERICREPLETATKPPAAFFDEVPATTSPDGETRSGA